MAAPRVYTTTYADNRQGKGIASPISKLRRALVFTRPPPITHPQCTPVHVFQCIPMQIEGAPCVHRFIRR